MLTVLLGENARELTTAESNRNSNPAILKRADATSAVPPSLVIAAWSDRTRFQESTFGVTLESYRSFAVNLKTDITLLSREMEPLCIAPRKSIEPPVAQGVDRVAITVVPQATKITGPLAVSGGRSVPLAGDRSLTDGKIVREVSKVGQVFADGLDRRALDA